MVINRAETEGICFIAKYIDFVEVYLVVEKTTGLRYNTHDDII